MIFRPILSLYLGLLLAQLPASSAAVSPRQDPVLAQLLDRVGKVMDRVWRQMSSVTCTELVTEEKLGDKGRVEHKQNSTFDYLMLIDLKKDTVSVEESRLPIKQAKESKTKPMLTTSGFPSLLLVFHSIRQVTDLNWQAMT